MIGSISFLADRQRPSTVVDAVRAQLVGRVGATVLAQAVARAERLRAHGIAPEAILRRVVAWALESRGPDDVA